jgi:hypothetical protein
MELKIRARNYKREHGRTSLKLEAKRVSFSFAGAFKIYANIWEGKNLVIPNQ